ncbi:MAG: hypothetical protein NTU97_03555 [Candidatus Magasanikbacteria bacterium]|nr:hypothetical protein [Candidatus Magasanikbacteria bacterium]
MTDNELRNREAKFQSRVGDIKNLLKDYLGLNSSEEVEQIEFLSAASLQGGHQDQLNFLNDPNLSEVIIGVVPDELWIKGSQPSESMVEKGLILIKKSYFDQSDDLAWMSHELGHYQAFVATTTELYEQAVRSSYPDNEVERHAFSKQFAYLQKKGLKKDEILAALSGEYNEEELQFLSLLIK